MTTKSGNRVTRHSWGWMVEEPREGKLPHLVTIRRVRRGDYDVEREGVRIPGPWTTLTQILGCL